LEVETLNAEQITSLFEHGVMPDEPEDAEIVEDNTKNSTETYDEIKEKANKSHEEAKQKAEEEKDSDEEQPTDANNNDEDESEKEEKLVIFHHHKSIKITPYYMLCNKGFSCY